LKYVSNVACQIACRHSLGKEYMRKATSGTIMNNDFFSKCLAVMT